MRRHPNNLTNLVVGVKHNASFFWCVAPINSLLPNLKALTPSAIKKLFLVQDIKLLREDCLQLSSNDAIETFAKNLRMFETSTEELSHDLSLAIKRKSRTAVDDFCPSLLFNLNAKTIYYFNPALKRFANFLCENIALEKRNFLELVPHKFQFWNII